MSDQITLQNNTDYIAQFHVRKGKQVIERLPGLDPHGKAVVPTTSSYMVTATTTIDGNTYTTAPQTVEAGMRFLAQIKQSNNQGTYDFEMVKMPGSRNNELQFEKTTLSPVRFDISKNGKFLQSVDVSEATNLVPIEIGDMFYIYAVINGVTTQTIATSDADANIVARDDTSDLDLGYFTLQQQS